MNKPEQPLSLHADLWEFQRRFYATKGMHAWRGGLVPEYITSNPFIADTYARLTIAYWQDCAAAGTLNPDEPCPIIELGAGSGRFAYLFLKRLIERLESRKTMLPPFVYIMTDVAPANIDAWRANTQLAPFAEAGWLDFARFDASRDESMELILGQTRLGPSPVTDTVTDSTGDAEVGEVSANIAPNPLVAIANYVLDSIPHDLYYVGNGDLYERCIAVESAQDEAAQPPVDDPAALHLTHTHRPLNPASVDDAEIQALLRRHMDVLKQTVFPLPVAALDTCRRMRRLAGDGPQARLLFLVGDKGYMTAAGMQAVGNPEKAVPGMAFHQGCFSLMVNFFALAHAATQQGGMALLPQHEPHRLGVAAFLYGDPAAGAPQKDNPAWETTRQAFAESVATFGPDDFYVLMQALESQFSTLPFHQVMALLRMSRWDPQILAGCMPALMAALDDLSSSQWDDLLHAIAHTVEHDYPSSTRYDLSYSLGRLFLARGEHTQALAHFERSLGRFGRNGQMLYEMALCHLELDNIAMAQHRLDQTLAVAPHHAPARELRLYLQRKSAGGS